MAHTTHADITSNALDDLRTQTQTTFTKLYKLDAAKRHLRKLHGKVDTIVRDPQGNYVTTITGRAYHSPDRVNISLTEPSHNYYTRQADSPKRVSEYIVSLLAINPTPLDWQDTRDDDIRSMDRTRIQHDHLPVWTLTPDVPRVSRHYILPSFTLEALTAIARHYFMGRQTSASYHQPWPEGPALIAEAQQIASCEWPELASKAQGLADEMTATLEASKPTMQQTSLFAYIERNYLDVDRPPYRSHLTAFAMEAIAQGLLSPSNIPPSNPYKPRGKPARSYSHAYPGQHD